MSKKTAIIVGATQGIGYALAGFFAGKNYDLGLISRNADKLVSVANVLKTTYSNLNVYIEVADVKDDQSIEYALNKLYKNLGHINVLINNAGIFEKGTVDDIKSEDYMNMILTNQFGAFSVLKNTVPIMKSQKEGYIFNIVSMSGVRVVQGNGAYCSSKYGFLALSESLSKELNDFGINVTAICPGFVDTEMTKGLCVSGNAVSNTDKIQVDDICKVVDCLLTLSSSARVNRIEMLSHIQL